MPTIDNPNQSPNMIEYFAIQGIERLAVPGGWIIAFGGDAGCFLEDQAHEWEPEVDPRRADQAPGAASSLADHIALHRAGAGVRPLTEEDLELIDQAEDVPQDILSLRDHIELRQDATGFTPMTRGLIQGGTPDAVEVSSIRAALKLAPNGIGGTGVVVLNQAETEDVDEEEDDEIENPKASSIRAALRLASDGTGLRPLARA